MKLNGSLVLLAAVTGAFVAAATPAEVAARLEAAPPASGAGLRALGTQYRFTGERATFLKAREVCRRLLDEPCVSEADRVGVLAGLDDYYEYGEKAERDRIAAAIPQRVGAALDAGARPSIAEIVLARKYSESERFTAELGRHTGSYAKLNRAGTGDLLADWLKVAAALEADPWCQDAIEIASNLLAKVTGKWDSRSPLSVSEVAAVVDMARFYPPVTKWLHDKAEAEIRRTSELIQADLTAGEWLWAYWTWASARGHKDWPEHHQREIVRYEPETPRLETLAPQAGFDGRETGLVRLTAKNALGDAGRKSWSANAWKNERVHGQFVVWTDLPVKQLRMETAPFVSAAGEVLPGEVSTRFVRYTMAALYGWKGRTLVPRQLIGDILDTAKSLDLDWNGFRPVWLTVKVAKDAKPGVYRSRLTVRGQGVRRVEFPLSVKVLDRAIVDVKDRKFQFEIWQHPWSIARYHGVEPFTPEHYRLMRPYYEAAAAAGVKAITCTLTDLPWNHQSYDPYLTMVRHLRQPDGSWKRDYSVFDEYVEFALSCGVGPQIHCYTMVTWGDWFHYEDAASGDRLRMRLVSGTPEHAEFWRDFLTDFERHLKARGWERQTYIGVDERSPEELAASVALLRKYAPSLKINMAVNRKPSEFKGIRIDDCCQYVGKMPKGFLEEARERTRQGLLTTFYVCCNPERPNTFMTSPLHEGRWCGLFAARGFDGFCRWALMNWMRDPFMDTTFGGDDGNWTPGDSFFLYPGPRASTRWEMLLDGFENYDKIRILRESGRASAELEQALKGIDYEQLKDLPDAEMEARILAVERILDDGE